MRWKGILGGMTMLLAAESAGADEPASPAPASPAAPSSLEGRLARSGWTGALDGSFGPFPGLSDRRVTVGLDGRFGYQLDSEHAFFTPEGILGFLETAGQQAGQGFHSETARIGFGARGGVRFWRLEPSVYVHLYVLYFGGTDLDIDAGGALDLRFSPAIAIGVHGAYNFLPASGDPGFALIGLHLSYKR